MDVGVNQEHVRNHGRHRGQLRQERGDGFPEESRKYKTGQVNGPDKKWPAIYTTLDMTLKASPKDFEMKFYLFVFRYRNGPVFYPGEFHQADLGCSGKTDHVPDSLHRGTKVNEVCRKRPPIVGTGIIREGPGTGKTLRRRDAKRLREPSRCFPRTARNLPGRKRGPASRWPFPPTT